MVSVPPASLDHKIRPAAVIYPDAFVIGAPAVAFPARRLAVLLGEPDTPVGVGRAIMPMSVVGGAGNRDRLSFAVGFNHKVSAAAVIYPNIPGIGAPTIAFLTSRFTALLG
jgi:hypothetical protein